MADKQVIAVVGATGAQGGGLARAILADQTGPFAARAITRNPKSDGARALAALGAEVVQADLDDEASLRRAFEGARGAYCVTNFWEHLSPEKEMVQAGNLARAAKAADLAHVVWSTLEDTRRFVPLSDDRMPTLGGKYKVPHFDAKGEANALFEQQGVPTTYLNTVFYWDNFVHFGSGPRREPDGSLVLTMPMGDRKMPGIAVADIGACAYGVFKAGSEFVDRSIGIASEHLTGQEMAAKLGEALGEPVAYRHVPWDVYRGFGFPGADDLGNMFQFYHDFADQFCASRPVELARRLHPGLQTLDQWLAENASKIPLT